MSSSQKARPADDESARSTRLGFTSHAPTLALAQRRALCFAFQPYVDTALRQVMGYEALVRGAQGEPAGEVFAGVAKTALHAFDVSCRAAAIRQSRKLGIEQGNALLNLNVLPKALGERGSWLLNTLAVCASEGFPTSRLVFEITELEHVSDPASLRDLMRDFREFRFRTAIDDLGAGWSSLELLVELQPDFVKLDIALISGIDGDARRRSLIRNLKSACDDLGCLIVAEGVEQAAESRCLDDLGIFQQQGYLFSRPVIGKLVRDPFFPC